MLCPRCGYKNSKGSKFCSECGLSLLAEQSRHPDVSNGILDIQPKADTSLPLEAASEKERHAEQSKEKPTDSVKGEPELESTGILDLPPLFDEDLEVDTDILDHPMLADDYDAIAPQDPEEEGEYLIDEYSRPRESAWSSGDTMEMPHLAEEPPAEQMEYKAPEKKKRSRGKVVAIVSVLLLLLVAGAAAGVSYQMEMWGGKTLPDVEGKDLAEASQVIEECGFVPKPLYVKSDDTENKVLLMDPGAGKRLSKGSEVVLQVATARIIPELVGLDLEDAESRLKAEGFENVELLRVKSNEPANLVLESNLEVGTKAKAHTLITLTIAEPYTVPSLAGLDINEAYEILEAEGYVVAELYEYSEEPEYTVLSSDPEAGSVLASGSTVSIILAKSRSAELIAATNSYLGGLSSIELGGTLYEIQSIDSVIYVDGSETQAVLTVVGVTTLADGETVRGSAKQKTLSLSWNDDNSIASYY